MWIGGEDLAFNHKLNLKRLCFLKAWVSLENVTNLIRGGLESIGIRALDVLSLDLDGNELPFNRSSQTLVASFNGPNACPGSTLQAKTWGAIKSQYRN